MYRPGAVGALLDIYEQAISDLKSAIEDIPDQDITVIVDPLTPDENCRTIQSILSHVVHSGYGYATSIHNLIGYNFRRPDKTIKLTIHEYCDDLSGVFSYTEKVFKDIRDNQLEELEDSLKIKTGWGQSYDIEQMMEHAIVHILRHRRQIEKIRTQELD